MGKASAITEHLYTYSDRGTQGAQNLQDWVSTVLAPALKAYQSGAAHGTGGANVDTGAVAARADSVHTHLPKQVARTFYTDRDVRNTANAFVRAGAEAAPQWPFGIPLNFRIPSEHLIRTTDDAVGGASWRAGGRAADALTEKPAGVLALLKKNIDDPDFCAGFVNSLSPTQLKFLMKLLFSRDGYNLPDMTGLRPGDGPPGALPGEYEQLVQPYQKVVFSVLTSGIQAMSPERAKQLLGDVADAMPKITPEQFAGIRPDLTAFLTTGARQVVEPLPTKLPGQKPREYWDLHATPWAIHAGQNLSVLQKYADWIGKISNPGSERGVGLGVTVVLEVITGAAMIAVPELLPLTLAVHGAAGAVVYTTEGQITPALFEAMHPEIEEFAKQLGVEQPKGGHEGAEDLAERMAVMMQDRARLTVALKVYKAGVLIPSHDGAEVWKAVDAGNLAPLVAKLHDEPDWLAEQGVKDGGNLENLVAEIGNQWKSEKPSHE